ncbi:MAG: heavy-metal-associated domain-containing protein [Acidobacteria bacterium]|nr:heavy-metal-associated domain-containing protein [Acidobacteriota bacterium]
MRPHVVAADRANTSATCIINVEGMACAGCAVAVKMAAGKLDGVTNVDVSLEENQARVAYDPAKTTPRAIAEAITKGTGFTAEPEPAVRD